MARIFLEVRLVQFDDPETEVALLDQSGNKVTLNGFTTGAPHSLALVEINDAKAAISIPGTLTDYSPEHSKKDRSQIAEYPKPPAPKMTRAQFEDMKRRAYLVTAALPPVRAQKLGKGAESA